MEYKDLPRWFRNRMTTIMNHNDYTQDMITVKVCEEKDKWTPADLVLREYYNNGGGSAKGFLGLMPRECIKCYEFIKENQNTFKDLDLISQKGYNNYGCTLWTEWKVH